MKKSTITGTYIKLISRPDDNGCWIWPKSVISSGYCQMYVDGKRQLAHRMSYECHYGVIPEGLCVCHRCDVPRCVNPDHLFLGTFRDNSLDAESKGRFHVQGDTSFTRLKRVRKLTDIQVIEIKASKGNLKDLAEKYKVSLPTISMIRRNKRKQMVG